MTISRRTRWGTAVLSLVALLGLATPANASPAPYGSLAEGAPSLGACSGSSCMAASSTFASYGTVSTLVTVTVRLYRTRYAGSTTASPSTDYLVKTVTSTYITSRSYKQNFTLSASQKCRTVASSTYGYYTRAIMTNGTVSGTVTGNSAVKQFKGCLSV